MRTKVILGLLIGGVSACGGRETARSGTELATRSGQLDSAPTIASSGQEALATGGETPIARASGPGVPPEPWNGDAGTATVPMHEDAGAPEDSCPYPNYPETEWSPEPWLEYTSTDPYELLASTRAILPGRWHGLVRTPWTTPYRVEIVLASDGHYSSRCSELPADCCVAFYYGSDEDTPLKQYRIGDATLGGNIFGEIDIAFKYGSEFGLPVWQGELSHIQRDASGNGLRFQFQTSHGYGPIEYDLRRQPSD